MKFRVTVTVKDATTGRVVRREKTRPQNQRHDATKESIRLAMKLLDSATNRCVTYDYERV